MKAASGDLIKMALRGEFDVIVHGCNCFHAMHSGIAKQIAEIFPEAKEIDDMTEYGDIDKLGKVSSVFTRGVRVVNAYTQFHPGKEEREVLYDNIRSCFEQVRSLHHGKRIGIPMIGCGVAPGDWNKIKEIITNVMKYENITVVYWSQNEIS